MNHEEAAPFTWWKDLNDLPRSYDQPKPGGYYRTADWRRLLHFTTKRTELPKKIEDRVDEILGSGWDFCFQKGDYPHQFSGGMKQRVVIAIALSCNPQLLIADEPTTALDVTIQAQVIAMMNELKRKLKTSLLMITHDLGIIAQTCEKVAVMYAGEIIEYGTAEDIFESDKHHPYTVGLFGSIPKLDEKTERLEQIDGQMPDPTNLPAGCKFHPRCKHCMEICRAEEPPVFIENEHSIKCHLYGQKQSV